MLYYIKVDEVIARCVIETGLAIVQFSDDFITSKRFFSGRNCFEHMLDERSVLSLA